MLRAWRLCRLLSAVTPSVNCPWAQSGLVVGQSGRRAGLGSDLAHCTAPLARPQQTTPEWGTLVVEAGQWAGTVAWPWQWICDLPVTSGYFPGASSPPTLPAEQLCAEPGP